MKTSLLLTTFIAIFYSQLGKANECKRVEKDIKDFDVKIEILIRTFHADPKDINDKIWVTKKINYMVEVDQYLRSFVMNSPFEQSYNDVENKCFWKLIGPRWKKIDESNTIDLQELMSVYGWFKRSEFGAELSHNAWLLAQHADRNPSFQKIVLARMEQLYPLGEVSSKDYAYLFDRVVWYVDQKPQKYGTQGRCVSPHYWQPWDIENIDTLEERRKSMGMEPFEENKARLDQICHFKLSQNREKADYENILQILSKNPGDNDKELLEYMQLTNPFKS